MMRSNDEPPRRDDDSRDDDSRELDTELRRVADALRRLPAVRPGAATRAAAAAAARGGPLVSDGLGDGTWRRRRSPRWGVGLGATAAAALLLVAGAVMLAVRGGRGDENADVSAPQRLATDDLTGGAVAVRPVSSADASAALEDAPLLVPFVVSLPNATRVSLVGDFNGWDPAATPLTAVGSGAWAVTVRLTPGRHAYGFVVDDTLWQRDPRAETERDVDFGRDHSVIVVGRP